MFFFKAHGLQIKSEINFPELIKNDSGADVTIKFGEIDPSAGILCEGVFRIASKYRITGDSVQLIWNDIEICEISHGKEIIVNRSTGIEENFLRALILGPAFGILLHQRSRLVLHASAVEIFGGAVAFMGFNRIGKSTTTMAFNYHGHPIVADDILSVEFDENGTPIVFPGFPRIKLWPEAAEQFYDDLEAFPRIHSESEKRSCFIGDFAADPLPLKRIYVIEKNEKMGVEMLKPQESVIELLRNSYCANIFQNEEQSSNLAQYADLAKKVQLMRLNVEDSLEKLSELVKIVEMML